MGTDPRRPKREARARGMGNRLSRSILFVVGWVFLAIGIAGLILPLLPGTVFLIASAACFTRSSPKFEAWLLDHPRLGPPVRQWRAKGAIPRYAKILAAAGMAVSWTILAFSSAPTFLKAALLVVFGTVIGYIASRPES